MVEILTYLSAPQEARPIFLHSGADMFGALAGELERPMFLLAAAQLWWLEAR